MYSACAQAYNSIAQRAIVKFFKNPPIATYKSFVGKKRKVSARVSPRGLDLVKVFALILYRGQIEILVAQISTGLRVTRTVSRRDSSRSAHRTTTRAWPFNHEVRARDNIRIIPRRYFAPPGKRMRTPMLLVLNHTRSRVRDAHAHGYVRARALMATVKY